MKTVIDVIKRAVDATAWCDSIEWRGQEVTLRKALKDIPLNDITGALVVKGWMKNLEEVETPRMRVSFKIKNYGCVRQRDPALATSAVKTRTHCFATFAVVMR